MSAPARLDQTHLSRAVEGISDPKMGQDWENKVLMICHNDPKAVRQCIATGSDLAQVSRNFRATKDK